mgnify:CR=1 FL=1
MTETGVECFTYCENLKEIKIPDTVEKIAETKSGIIKPGSAVAVYDNVPSVIEVIERHAHACGDRIYYAKDEELKYELSLVGAHQRNNAKTVLAINSATPDKSGATTFPIPCKIFLKTSKTPRKMASIFGKILDSEIKEKLL